MGRLEVDRGLGPSAIGPEELLREGEPEAALTALQVQVRDDPANPRLRTFLFQLLCVLGDWQRARDQLKVLGELEVGSLPLVHVYGAAVACEMLRKDVFSGARTPMVLGEPLPWLAPLVQALSAEREGQSQQAQECRANALEQAKALPGTIDGQAFEWIADADSRLGPVCEAIIDGLYYWVPFERIRSLSLDAPSDLRDVVWMPAQLRLENAGEVSALLPARYPGSETHSGGPILLGRKTEWDEVFPDTFHGHGQRMLATNVNEYPMLSIRKIELAGA